MNNKVFILLISTTFVIHAQVQDPKAEAILDAVSAKYEVIKSYKADFSYELENPQAKVNEKFEGNIMVKGNKFTINMGNQVIINNGNTVWTYLKDENEVNVSDFNPDDEEITPSKIHSMYRNGYKYLWLEEEKGKTGTHDVIDLVPENKNKNYFKIRIWINKKEKSIARWKIFDKNGNRYLYQIKNFDPQAKIEESTFTFDKAKYPNVEVVDLR
ncbi:MAG: outer membrane lipoprotein carrier protein LolA [Cytophagales bacterium]|nr:outer membrane lipoprotein carrier protein LolA [Cytophagales bacterium]